MSAQAKCGLNHCEGGIERRFFVEITNEHKTSPAGTDLLVYRNRWNMYTVAVESIKENGCPDDTLVFDLARLTL